MSVVRWLRDALAAIGFVARQSVVSLRYNWGIGLLSLVLAASLWVYVTDKENPEKVVRVPGAVPIEAVNVPPDQAVFPPLDQTVTVRVRAAENLLDGLAAEDFRATVDLSDVSSQEETVPVHVESQDARVEVVDVQPAEVVVRLENVTSKTVPVRTELVGAPPRGYQASEPVVQPAEATVTGARTLVDKVDALQADVNLTGVHADFQETVLLQPQDNLGNSVEGLEVQPQSATVTVDITQLEFSGPLLVRPSITGTPASGYNVTAVSVDPAIVVVSGPADVFQNIDPVAGLATADVSIDGATADVVRTVALQLPPGATTDQSTVTVRVAISAAQGAFTYSVPVQEQNVGSGLVANLSQGTVDVVLSGPIPALAAVTVDQISATIDLQDLDAGEHSVPVQVQAPAGLALSSVTPAQVQVTLRAQ